ncbi:MAG: hypothetical protein WC490_00065 [Candidatus Margulisiibacteriota bacterium]
MNISQREKYWALAAAACLVFFVYWTFLLDPLLGRVSVLHFDSGLLKAKVQRLSQPQSGSPQQDKKVMIHPKEEQLAMVVGFIESRIKESKLALLSLKQVSSDNKISIEIETEGSYQNSVVFFEEMSELDTVFEIDSVNMSNDNKKIISRIKILTPFL